MTDRRDIDERLKNWAAWCNTSDRYVQGASSPTGAACERMRLASIGELPGGYIDRPAAEVVDATDALLIGRALVKVTFNHRRMLGWHYIEAAPRGYVSRILRFHVSQYDALLQQAQAAIEAVAK